MFALAELGTGTETETVKTRERAYKLVFALALVKSQAMRCALQELQNETEIQSNNTIVNMIYERIVSSFRSRVT